MPIEDYIVNLTSNFRTMLKEAEQIFGSRNMDWSFLGLEFREDGPYINYYPNQTYSIVLSSGCLACYEQAIYQLSHEVCHTLYLTGKADANVLNEGVSTYFSAYYHGIKFFGSDYATRSISKSRYFEAYNLVTELLNNDHLAIIKLRKVNCQLSYIQFSDFAFAGVEFDSVKAKRLAELFDNS